MQTHVHALKCSIITMYLCQFIDSTKWRILNTKVECDINSRLVLPF